MFSTKTLNVLTENIVSFIKEHRMFSPITEKGIKNLGTITKQWHD